ncbi:MAG: DUF2779 domain-containing protein [Bdellovibrionales bacterium]|nr:DUF2779 domain-containing protein [Bdellovibrionales bacterium]
MRALKSSLEKNQGTVFRYSAHENTVLNHIRVQLLDSEAANKDELITFIETLTVRKVDNKIVHQGDRCMVDLCELVKKYYYSPLMGGSNSIKRVLPSVLQESAFLREKYSKPIYGIPTGIKSHNFKDKVWFKFGADGLVADPYKSLDPIFTDVDPSPMELVERIFADEEIKEGAASTAYARMHSLG